MTHEVAREVARAFKLDESRMVETLATDVAVVLIGLSYLRDDVVIKDKYQEFTIKYSHIKLRLQVDTWYDVIVWYHNTRYGYVQDHVTPWDAKGKQVSFFDEHWIKRMCHPVRRGQKRGQMKLLSTAYRFILANKLEINKVDDIGKVDGISYVMIGGGGHGTRASTHVYPLARILTQLGYRGRIIMIDGRATNGEHRVGNFNIVMMQAYVEKVVGREGEVTIHTSSVSYKICVTHIINDAYLPGNDLWKQLQIQTLEANVPTLLKKPLERGVIMPKVPYLEYEQYFAKDEQRVVVKAGMTVPFPRQFSCGCGCSSCEDLAVLFDRVTDLEALQYMAFLHTFTCVRVHMSQNLYSMQSQRGIVFGAMLHGRHAPAEVRAGVMLDHAVDIASVETVDNAVRALSRVLVEDEGDYGLTPTEARLVQEVVNVKPRFDMTLERIAAVTQLVDIAPHVKVVKRTFRVPWYFCTDLDLDRFMKRLKIEMFLVKAEYFQFGDDYFIRACYSYNGRLMHFEIAFEVG